MSEKTNIIIIDDHRIVRKGIKELLENLGDYVVIDEFENGVNFIGELPELKTVPDVFILDYSMPMLNGIEVLQKAINIKEDYKFLLLTQHLEEDIIDNAYKYGARGFLNKTCTAQDLKFAIDNIVTFGYTNISEILKRIRNYNEVKPNKALSSLELSDKELFFLELVCDENEYTYNEIADKMNVSVKTVDFYRGKLFTKLNVKSKVGLVLYSYKYQLTKPFIKEQAN
jgi:DNA-binding NarL/FixJ family response regulator